MAENLRTWAEINLDNLKYNIAGIKNRLDKKTLLMCAVKANAYGHGAVEISKAALNFGADRLATATLKEAVELRRADIKVPVLVLNHIELNTIKEALANDITLTVFSIDMAEKINNIAGTAGKKAVVHIKIDTGMARVGFSIENACECIKRISQYKNIFIEGIYSHLSSADEEDGSYTLKQFEEFMNIMERVRKEGIKIPLRHICNSAGIIRYPGMHLDMVRLGIAMYGVLPSVKTCGHLIDVKQVMSLKARIIRIFNVRKGQPVSYGRTFTAKRDSVIAVVSAGYADGYSRKNSNKGRVLVNGRFAAVAGRVCMDQFMIDITDIKGNADVGDEVVLFGLSEDKKITLYEVADVMETIPYEVVCLITSRVPRIFKTEV